MAPDDIRHGTLNGYRNLGCRCQPCRDANTAAMRVYRHAHPEQSERQAAYRSARYAAADGPGSAKSCAEYYRSRKLAKMSP